MHKSHCYILETKSKLHAGEAGDELSYIDKEVQREDISGLPIINETAVKGFLKEFVSYKAICDAHENDENPGAKLLKTIFGSDTTSNYPDNITKNINEDTKKKIQKGQIFFDSAKLLSLPVRAMENYYYRATSDVLLKEFISHVSAIEYKYKGEIGSFLDVLETGEFTHPIIFEENKTIEIDVDEAIAKYPDWIDDIMCKDTKEALEDLIGERVVVLPHALFEKVSEDLPVVDRNVLDNGTSVNLWFEEVVPRESKFYFVLLEPNEKITLGDEVGVYFKQFQAYFPSNPVDIVHVGGSITVGYGRCLVYPLATGA